MESITSNENCIDPHVFSILHRLDSNEIHCKARGVHFGFSILARRPDYRNTSSGRSRAATANVREFTHRCRICHGANFTTHRTRRKNPTSGEKKAKEPKEA